MKKAVVLLSGGLDSATVLAVAKHQGFACHALSFDYGQRHRQELVAAVELAKTMGVAKHVVLNLNLRQFGGSALTADIAVPKDRPTTDLARGIPVTYVPARNTVFLSCALAWAEVLECFDIFIGVNALDYSGYPDCRPDFIAAFEHTANLATRAGIEGRGSFKIHAPLMALHKTDIIQLGISLNVDYGKTWTCYAPDTTGVSCGHCDACQLRLAAFQQMGLSDPIPYARNSGGQK
ncbi:MAG: 7-cyano-7-deazaguanine synthase QueC [Phycisphaerae bacterium]